jgi:uncharacterized protein (TIGR04141 family)
MGSLTCYLIREKVGGEEVGDFDDVIDSEDLERVRTYGPVSFEALEARLYVAEGTPSEPLWTSLLRGGFPDLSVPALPSLGAVLVARLLHAGKTRYLAFTFGSGRFLLGSDAWEHSFGLKTALNVVFEGDDGSLDASRLRLVDAKRVEANTLHTRRQSNRRAPLETFDVDLRRDLLQSVDGRPVDSERWGDRIGGADPLHLNVEINFANLGDLCTQILNAHERTDYRVRFSWVDNIRVVTEAQELAGLEQKVLADLHARNIRHYDLAFPEIIDWPRVARFQFDFDRRKTVLRPEPRLSDYLTGLSAAAKLDELDIARLKRMHLYAVDADGNPAYRWTIWRCLTGEVTLDGRQYLLDGGAFYEIAQDYLTQINQSLDDLDEWSGDLPDCAPGLPEPAYNELAAGGSSELLLLDRQLVRAPERTSPIEVCDLLARDGTLVHVKKGWGAADLSHLFAQGAVSAELLLTMSEFRAAAMETIAAVDSRRSEENRAATPLQQFKLFREEGLSPADHAIVYAVVGPWDSADLADKLPFFSKVNLLRSLERVERLGFNASFRRIPLAAP